MPSPVQMLILGFLIGLTGALAPGPTLIATINASLKGGWTMGPRVTLGHAVVEVFMVVLIIMGLSVTIGEYSGVIAGIGGIALVAFGILTLVESRQAEIELSKPNGVGCSRGPFFAGVLTSISNPYFWLWWFTIGSALLLGAMAGGVMAAVLFIFGHWAADLSWLTLVSASIHKGRFFLGKQQYRIILGLCGIFLIIFGGYYISTIWTWTIAG